MTDIKCDFIGHVFCAKESCHPAVSSRHKRELLRSQAMQLRRSVAFIASVLLPLLVGTPCFGDNDPTPARAKGKGRITIVYQDDAIEPENRDAIKKIRDSGVFERMADRLTKAVALPHDLQVVVTDKLPKGIDDPTTEVDGRRIFWPAAFSCFVNCDDRYDAQPAKSIY
jgi:hypothetical protein